MDEVNAKRLSVLFKKGERNVPAENFVETYLKAFVTGSAPFEWNQNASLAEVEIIKGR